MQTFHLHQLDLQLKMIKMDRLRNRPISMLPSSGAYYDDIGNHRQGNIWNHLDQLFSQLKSHKVSWFKFFQLLTCDFLLKITADHKRLFNEFSFSFPLCCQWCRERFLFTQCLRGISICFFFLFSL